MLGKLRDFSRSKLAGVLIAIIIIPFVFWGMGSVFSGGNANNVAKIDNKNISTQDFIEYVNSSRINPDDLRNNLDKNILEEILSQIISLQLLKMEIDDASLIISDQILFNKIIKDKKFQENNKFSRIKYEKFLLENNSSAVEYEAKLKDSELQADLFQYISGGVISPKFYTKNKYLEETKKINVKYINLEKLYKSEFTKDEIEKYINDNIEELKRDYITFSYTEISPKTLIDGDEFNKSFFNELDNLENDILNGSNINELKLKYNLDLNEKVKYSGLEKNKTYFSEIYKNRNGEKIQIIEYDEFYLLYEISKIEKLLPETGKQEFRDKVVEKLKNLEKFNYNKEILQKIESKNFFDSDFVKIAKNEGNINSAQINSIDDSSLFNVDSLNLLYTIPENDFLLIVDNNMNVYLTKVIDFEYNNFNEQSEEFNKSSIKSKIILKNYISMAYDDYINSKYDVNIFNNTIERLKNYFK